MSPIFTPETARFFHDLEEERIRLFESHPLLVGKEILPTPLLASLLHFVRTLVMLRTAGCWMGAPSGMGKSSALTYLEENLPLFSSLIQVIRYNAPTQTQLAVRGFQQKMLTTLGHALLTGETAMLRERVFQAFRDRARIRGKPLIVLLFDETQAMKREELYFVKDITNDSAKSDAQIVTILVGQEPQMSEWIAKLTTESKLDLAARFGLRRLPFPAYSTLEDLKGLLEAIDTAVYPAGSGITWTQFFFPKAWVAGFRLAGQASALLGVLTATAQSLGKGKRFPVREVMFAVRFFVTTNAARDAPNMSFPVDAWERAVEVALLFEATKLTGDEISWADWEVVS